MPPDPALAAALDPERRFDNRELSWLAFNRRVLEEAEDAGNPLIERARFLAIVASNLDEFCMVRLAELVSNRDGVEPDPAGLMPQQQLRLVRDGLQRLVADQYRCWREEVAPALQGAGFEIVAPSAWTEQDRGTLAALYRTQIEPALTPLAVDPTRPFPLLAGGGIHIAVELRPEPGTPSGTAQHGREPLRALVSVPGGARLFALVGEPGRYALIEDVVEHFIDESVFPGYRIVQRAMLRITRDGALDIDEDQAVDFLEEIEEELRQRAHGPAVRLELEHDAPTELRDWLQERLELDDEAVVDIQGPLDLTLLMGLDAHLARRDLGYPSFAPRPYPCDWSDPWAAIRRQDVLVHHPFDSFKPITELMQQAADDPRVLAIKQTLYRVSGDSPVVGALVRAARNGKQVTVILELKARFDEERNIQWARRLEQAGAHVIYGLVGYKVHSKLLLIIRRDEDGIRRYCHVGTGNYNDKTAAVYTDLGMFTANEAVGRDLSDLFNMLTGFSVPPDWERLAVSPLTMRETFNRWIRREAEHARQGRGGRIRAKFNSLVDIGICEELYAASAAGVEIDLIVRGMCTLRAGVPGLSERIRVRSVVGRFLEHSRIYHFANAGEPVYAIGSCDWMTRNLDRRVESLVTVADPRLQGALDDILEIFLVDNDSARVLLPDGSYRRLRAGSEPAQRAQDQLLASIAEAGEGGSGAATKSFVPLRRPRRR